MCAWSNQGRPSSVTEWNKKSRNNFSIYLSPVSDQVQSKLKLWNEMESYECIHIMRFVGHLLGSLIDAIQFN